MNVDLTDTWSGRFSYARAREPVSFVATITQDGEWLAGATEEEIARGPEARSVITATLSGRITYPTVSFLKIYDREVRGYDAVQYNGVVDADHLEINGVWTIHGNWSGTFLMIRATGLASLASMRQSERV